ncbi:MAG: hypothetical protein RLZZ232_3408 [Planctomycetota bacterium]
MTQRYCVRVRAKTEGFPNLFSCLTTSVKPSFHLETPLFAPCLLACWPAPCNYQEACVSGIPRLRHDHALQERDVQFV